MFTDWSAQTHTETQQWSWLASENTVTDSWQTHLVTWQRHVVTWQTHLVNICRHMTATPRHMTDTPHHMTETRRHMSSHDRHTLSIYVVTWQRHVITRQTHLVNTRRHMTDTPRHMTETRHHMTDTPCQYMSSHDRDTSSHDRHMSSHDRHTLSIYVITWQTHLVTLTPSRSHLARHTPTDNTTATQPATADNISQRLKQKLETYQTFTVSHQTYNITPTTIFIINWFYSTSCKPTQTRSCQYSCMWMQSNADHESYSWHASIKKTMRPHSTRHRMTYSIGRDYIKYSTHEINEFQTFTPSSVSHPVLLWLTPELSTMYITTPTSC